MFVFRMRIRNISKTFSLEGKRKLGTTKNEAENLAAQDPKTECQVVRSGLWEVYKFGNSCF